VKDALKSDNNNNNNNYDNDNDKNDNFERRETIPKPGFSFHY